MRIPRPPIVNEEIPLSHISLDNKGNMKDPPTNVGAWHKWYDSLPLKKQNTIWICLVWIVVCVGIYFLGFDVNRAWFGETYNTQQMRKEK